MRPMKPFVSLFILVFFFSPLLKSVNASERKSELRYVRIDQSNKDLPCPTGFIVDRENFKGLEELLYKINLTPDCIWTTIKKNAENIPKKINGFSYGTLIEASLGVGVMLGTELVLMPSDDDSIIAAMVRIEGGSLGVGLAGASLSQSVIYGDCPHKIESYLGMFKSVGAIAMMNNYGFTGLFGRRTGCDSITSIRGLTSPVIGTGFSFYNLVSGPIKIRGSKIQELKKYFEGLN